MAPDIAYMHHDIVCSLVSGVDELRVLSWWLFIFRLVLPCANHLPHYSPPAVLPKHATLKDWVSWSYALSLPDSMVVMMRYYNPTLLASTSADCKDSPHSRKSIVRSASLKRPFCDQLQLSSLSATAGIPLRHSALTAVRVYGKTSPCRGDNRIDIKLSWNSGYD